MFHFRRSVFAAVAKARGFNVALTKETGRWEQDFPTATARISGLTGHDETLLDDTHEFDAASRAVPKGAPVAGMAAYAYNNDVVRPAYLRAAHLLNVAMHVAETEPAGYRHALAEYQKALSDARGLARPLLEMGAAAQRAKQARREEKALAKRRAATERIIGRSPR